MQVALPTCGDQMTNRSGPGEGWERPERSVPVSGVAGAVAGWWDGGVFVTRDEVRLNVVQWGPSGAPAFVGHGGWIGSWELWQEPFQLMQSRWRCVSYDHRGSGATTAEPSDISPEALVADLWRVLDELGVDRCVLAGESMGALTVLGAALEHPERVAGLVIVDGKTSGESSVTFIQDVRCDFVPTVRAFVDACVPEPASEHVRRWGRQILLRADKECAARLLEVMAPVRPDVERLGIPTLIVHGEQDVVVPLEDARALHARMPNSELITLPGAGHVPTLTRPREVVEAIDQWWARVSTVNAT